MNRQRALQTAPTPAEQPERRSYRVYTVAQLLGPDLLNMNRKTFFRLRAKGELPFLEEIEPRLGRVIRYRADLVDRYLAGQWQRESESRTFFGGARRAHGRQLRSASTPQQGNKVARASS